MYIMCYQVLNFEVMLECIGQFNTKVSFSQNVLQMYVWSYIVGHPVCRTAQSAFTSYPGINVHSDTHSGKHSAMLQLLCEDFTRQSPVFYHILLADMLFGYFFL